MSNPIEIAEQTLLQPTGLTENQIQTVLGRALGKGIDGADIYFQSTHAESWVLEDGIVKEGAFDVAQGVGIRAMSGEKTGFAYSDEIVLTALEDAATAAHSIVKQGDTSRIQIQRHLPEQNLYPASNPLNVITENEKIALLHTADKAARAQDSHVVNVTVALSGSYNVVLIADSEGGLSADIRPMVRLNIDVIVEKEGRRERGASGGGGRHDYTFFLDNNKAVEYAKEAVRLALVNLDADSAPAGSMPVVLGPGWPGVLLHEAIGHGLEGDFNRRKVSAFANQMGEQVASRLCTIVDDGTLPSRRGSLNIDDEGTQTECTMLIENGILKNYMQDKHNARLMGMRSTGNGRRESYAHMPMPRMTNTYMLAGQSDPQEIIASVDKGLYAVNFDGGQVDITSGKFVFTTSEAYLIENGKITKPVKGATLIGSGPEVLKKVSMVGNDLALDQGVGVCGKEGQSVPVGVGQPTLKVDALTVGGTH